MIHALKKLPLVLWVAAALAGLTGCATPTPGVGGALTNSELSRLRLEQQQLAEQVTTLNDDVTLLKSQLAGQEALIADIQQELMAQSETGGQPATPAKEAGEPTTPDTGTLSPTEVYQRAFAEYASGRYRQSVQGFEQFLRAFPDSRYAGNAQYWLAEGLYAQQEFGRAISAFEAVVKRYPQGGKAPEALYKLAVIHHRLRQQEKMQEYIDKLQSLYPESSAAKKALQKEGF